MSKRDIPKYSPAMIDIIPNMPKSPRQASSTNTYHVTARGVGKHRIFEEDSDRQRMLDSIVRFKKKYDVTVMAWVFMENHLHILINAELTDLSSFMSSLLTSYSQAFNGRHGHVGHVFQGRYHSEPVENDSYLLEVVRYIHLNPLSSGIDRLEDYRWSSYRQYCGEAGICDTSMVLHQFQSIEDLKSFHNCNIDQEMVYLNGYHPRIDDAQAADIAESMYGPHFSDKIVSMKKGERDRAVQRLYIAGLSGAQITRLLGLGRNIVQKACAKIKERAF